jgi:hypothetical protein
MKTDAFFVAGLALLTCVSAPAAATPNEVVSVRCDTGQTIGHALAKLDKMRPNVLRVSGTCRENVIVTGFDDLTIVGRPGATLLPVPAGFGIEVTASRQVSIEALTIRMTGAQRAMGFSACDACYVKDVTVDGGQALYALQNSYVTVSRLTVTGNTGGWAGIAAFMSASVIVEDSSFDGGGRACGLRAGENSTALIYRSEFRNFGVGILSQAGGQVTVYEDTTFAENDTGLSATNGGHIDITKGLQGELAAHVVGNHVGISVDGNAWLSVGQAEIAGNSAKGIVLNHHAFADLRAGTTITSNGGPGLEVRNGSMAMGPPRYTGDTIEVSRNNNGDLVCDSISHINNAIRITGTANNRCLNIHDEDAP